MLAKPAQEIAHGGGLRFEKDSDYYKIIYNWIAQGVPFGDPAKDSVVEMKVEPKEIFMPKPGETAAVKVVVALSGRADPRRHAGERSVESNIPDVAPVDVKAASVKGERDRRGDAAGAVSGKILDHSGDRAESQAWFRLEAAAAVQLHRSRRSTPNWSG